MYPSLSGELKSKLQITQNEIVVHYYCPWGWEQDNSSLDNSPDNSPLDNSPLRAIPPPPRNSPHFKINLIIFHIKYSRFKCLKASKSKKVDSNYSAIETYHRFDERDAVTIDLACD